MPDIPVQDELFSLEPVGSSPTFPLDWRYHGSTTGYSYGCRCERCRIANRASRKASADAHRGNGSKRICKRCASQYVYIPLSGSGTKYCAECKKLAYQEAVRRGDTQRARHAPCPCCGLPCRQIDRKWGLCDACYALLPSWLTTRLRSHHASVEFVLAIPDPPRCGICNRDVSERRKDHKGRMRWRFALDHDHHCCPGDTSCGECLRGILCTSCNAALGFFGDDAATVVAAARYLSRTRRSDDGRTRTVPKGAPVTAS